MESTLIERCADAGAADRRALGRPLVSVVVPTFRRPKLLERCLRALAVQSLDAAAYEVVVADDAHDTATRAQVERVAAAMRAPLRYVVVIGSHGPAAARNAGWRAARGDIIAFTDDDTIPEPRWLACGLAAFAADPGLAAVTGRIVVPVSQPPTDYERNEAGLEGAEFVTANCFCRREALDAVGGFDERFRAAWREDSDLHFALLEAGRRIARTDEAVVCHPVRPAPWGVSLRQQRKAHYDALLYKKHPALYGQRIVPGRPWNYYAIVMAIGGAVLAAVFGAGVVALVFLAVWVALTAEFCFGRLRGASRSWAHRAEMLVTSALIPPLSVFWRLYGAVRFGVWFC
jgi:glycosyltransferase involved in cell wall biosynthesis